MNKFKCKVVHVDTNNIEYKEYNIEEHSYAGKTPYEIVNYWNRVETLNNKSPTWLYIVVE